MKKMILSAALLGMAGAASAFANVNISGGGDFASTSIIRGTLGAAPDGGALATVSVPGVSPNAGGIVLLDKSGSNLTVVLNESAFTAASDALAGLGTINAAGSLVIEGSNLQTFASNLGIASSDLTARRLVIKRAGGSVSLFR